VQAARRYAPRRWQFDSRRIYVRPRTGPQSTHLWWPAVPIAQGSCAVGQTDGQTDGRIALSLNAAALRRGIVQMMHGSECDIHIC